MTDPHAAARLPRTDLTLDDARRKLAGWHFGQEALTTGEREILYVAEAVLRGWDQEAAELALVRGQLEQAQGLLWLVAVWFGNGEGQSTYVARDLALVNAWVNKHELTDPDEGRRKATRARAALAFVSVPEPAKAEA